MSKINRKKNKTQSILEYLAVLIMVVGGGTAATIFFGSGVSSGLGQTENHIQEVLPQAVDNTYEATVVPLPEVVYTGEPGPGGTE
ncbi:MAG: hypothetical protein K9L86_00155 [Candidatus Omnitrophica bacterium]|nr:hypothetical protein [Candidatus Omnitrophota bacterium]